MRSFCRCHTRQDKLSISESCTEIREVVAAPPLEVSKAILDRAWNTLG